MLRPLIGITTHAPDAQHRAALDRLHGQIVRGVERAGGLPVIIPPGLPEPARHGVFARIDGLLLAGGGDVDPVTYGARPDMGSRHGPRMIARRCRYAVSLQLLTAETPKTQRSRRSFRISADSAPWRRENITKPYGASQRTTWRRLSV